MSLIISQIEWGRLEKDLKSYQIFSFFVQKSMIIHIFIVPCGGSCVRSEYVIRCQILANHSAVWSSWLKTAHVSHNLTYRMKQPRKRFEIVSNFLFFCTKIYDYSQIHSSVRWLMSSSRLCHQISNISQSQRSIKLLHEDCHVCTELFHFRPEIFDHSVLLLKAGSW